MLPNSPIAPSPAPPPNEKLPEPEPLLIPPKILAGLVESAGVFGLQMFTEPKRPPVGSELVVPPLAVLTGALVEVVDAITGVGLLVIEVVLLVTVASLGVGLATAAENMPKGAGEADVAAAVVVVLGASDVGTAGAVPPKPRDDPNPPKLNGELEALPTAPPVPVKPPKPKDLLAVSAFGVCGATFAASGPAFTGLISSPGFCSLGLAGSGADCSFSIAGFGTGADSTAGDPPPNESADLAPPPPKLKLELPLLRPPNMERPGLAASPGVTVFVVGVTVEVFTNGLLWLKENGVDTGVATGMGFSAATGLDGIGFGS